MESRTVTGRTSRRLIPTLLLAIIVLVSVPGMAADPVTQDNVAEKLASASTAADHAALATYFRAEAAKAGAEVERHEKMLSSIRTKGGKPYRNNRGHCRNLIRSNRLEQEAFEDLASEQEIEAKETAH
jgi:hypothetical protein